MNAIITGATKGIGQAIALTFAKNDIDLCLCSRNKEELIAFKNELQELNNNITVHTQACDVSVKNEVNKFGDYCLNQFSEIDILVNNAGFFTPGDIHKEEDGMLEKMIETNLYSAYNLSRKIVPSMQKNKKGLIINISSVAGLQAYPQGGSYSISKFALTGFSKNLRNELKDYNIKVSTIYPGATFSNSWSGSGIDENRIMAAQDIATSVFSLTQLSSKAVVEDIVLRPQLGDL